MKLGTFLWPVLVMSIIFFGCDSSVAPDTSEPAVSMEDSAVFSAKKGISKDQTIQGGKLLRSDGEVITVGYDEWGYNYQAHMFKGGYCDSYRDAAWCQPYKDVNLLMKWNGAWLDNVDMDDDGLLDRFYGFDSYIGSGAWLTNHQSGEYEEDGKMCKWNYFTKIVAAPADANAVGGIWYTTDGVEIGPVIWGSFATIQQVSNDPCFGEKGLLYKGEAPTGFGFY